MFLSWLLLLPMFLCLASSGKMTHAFRPPTSSGNAALSSFRSTIHQSIRIGSKSGLFHFCPSRRFRLSHPHDDYSDVTASRLLQLQRLFMAKSPQGDMNQNNPSPTKKVQLTRRNVLTTLAVTIISIPLLAEAYSRLGSVTYFRTKHSQQQQKLPSLLKNPPHGWDDIQDVTIVFHGSGGQDQYTDELMTNLQLSSLSSNNKFRNNNNKSYATIIDWSKYSSNIIQASFNGQQIGREVATQLLQSTFFSSCLSDTVTTANNTSGVNSGNSAASPLPRPLPRRTIHVIGISVGAFAADSTVRRIHETLLKKNRQSGSEKRREDVYIQLTLLDPFIQRGVLDPWYGVRNFGRGADYAQQFLNTDDPVPATSTPLPQCACIDVTSLRPSEIFGHDWPLVYYTRLHSGKNKDSFLVLPKERREIGTVASAGK